MSRRIPVLSLSLLTVLTAVPAGAQEHEHAVGGPERLGRVEFPISCSEEAQRRFGRAMALLHSFWWSEAERAFDSVAEADPSCAMAYWGKALVARGNWFAAPPSPDATRAAVAAVERGLELNPPTERERGYLEAAAVLFRDAEARPYPERARAYEAAMRSLHERFPDDPEAAIFYALAVRANATAEDKTFERPRQAGAILEPMFERTPDHPGLAHYIIHNYDFPPIAQHGVEAAKRYGQIAPSVPHAQHMPSHIFTRIGMWEESIEANRASAEAARAYEEAQGQTSVSFDRAHAWDYLAYAYLQQGKDEAARQMVADVRSSTGTSNLATDYAFAAIPARYALERERWGDAVALEVRPTPGFRAAEAITHFARGIGAARSGDAARARAEAEALAAIRDELAARGDMYWSQAVEAQRLAVSGWAAHAEGASAEGLEQIAQAAEIEERIDKHPVTPGPILPARELEGDLLMELGRAGEALRAYRETLETEPNRARAVFGAARAAERAGDAAAAREYYGQYLALMQPGDRAREEVRIAEGFVSRR